MTRLAEERVLCDDALGLALTPDDEAEGPATWSATLGRVGTAEVGLWEIDAGEALDTEVDEIFVVLGGSGAVTFEGRLTDRAPAGCRRTAPRRGPHPVDHSRAATEGLRDRLTTV